MAYALGKHIKADVDFVLGKISLIIFLFNLYF